MHSIYEYLPQIVFNTVYVTGINSQSYWLVYSDRQTHHISAVGRIGYSYEYGTVPYCSRLGGTVAAEDRDDYRIYEYDTLGTQVRYTVRTGRVFIIVQSDSMSTATVQPQSYLYANLHSEILNKECPAVGVPPHLLPTLYETVNETGTSSALTNIRRPNYNDSTCQCILMATSTIPAGGDGISGENEVFPLTELP